MHQVFAINIAWCYCARGAQIEVRKIRGDVGRFMNFSISSDAAADADKCKSPRGRACGGKHIRKSMTAWSIGERAGRRSQRRFKDMGHADNIDVSGAEPRQASDAVDEIGL